MTTTIRLLRPGVRLMQRLRFAEKFILVCLLFTIPLGMTSYYLLHDIQRKTAIMAQRQMGLRYIEAISPLMELIPRHRGLINGVLHGNRAFSNDLTALAPRLQQALTRADRANQRWGEALGVRDAWRRIRNRWLALRKQSTALDANQSWQQHTRLIADFLQLLSRVVVASTLFTTEDAASRHLIALNFHHLPQLIEALGQLRGIGAGLLADRRIAPQERQQIRLMQQIAQRSADEVARQWRFYAEYNANARLAAQFQQLQALNRRYQRHIEELGSAGRSPHDYFALGTQAISAGYALLHGSSAQLQTRFDQRGRQLAQRAAWVRALLLLVPLVILYLVLAFFFSTRATTRQLQLVVSLLQQRKAPAITPPPGRDELAEIVGLFNRLSRQIIRKHEEDALMTELTHLALRSHALPSLCDRTLVLLMGAQGCLGARSPSHIQLLRGSGSRYIAASTYHDAVVLTIPDPTSAIYQLSFGDHPMICIPLIHEQQRLGELILTVDHAEEALTSRRHLLEHIASTLVIAIIRLQADAALKQREQALTRSNEELERFAYVASHDLQEPLRKICSFGDRLRKRADLEGRNLDFLNRMVDAAGRMQLLIQDLLAFSRIQATTRPFTPVDLQQVARQAVDNLMVAIQECDAVVEIGTLPTIDGDPVQLEQLLQNLIGNAIKYRRPDTPPRVRLQLVQRDSLASGEELLHFVCRDNGIGFEQKYADQIFEAFKRLHGRKEYSGSGIGLALCRRIVERHGGTIHATSTPSEGTCIHFSLQAKQHKE